MTNEKTKRRTSREVRSYRKTNEENVFFTYLNEIDKIPILTKEEEIKAANLASTGNKAARDKLINSNLRFVVMIAKKFQNKGLPLEDLVSEGNIGLIYALNHYNVDKGYRFITYAVWWIRQSIIRAIHDKGRMIRLPANKSKALARTERVRQILNPEIDDLFNWEIQEISDVLNISSENAASLIQIGQNHVSLDDPAFLNIDYLSLIDCLEDIENPSPAEEAIYSIMKEDMEKALMNLGERDAEIIRCRYGLGSNNKMTLKEVGERYNLTRERIRQIESKILGQLRKSSVWKNMEGYTA